MVRMGNNPSGSHPNFFGRQHLTFDKGGKGVGNFRGIVRKRRSQRGGVGAVKALLLYYEHHFDEYRKLNIKNPLFTLMADFCVGKFCRGGACVKSNMVYTLCKHMVYMLSITNEHKNELEMRAKPEWKVHFLCFASAKRGSFSIR